MLCHKKKNKLLKSLISLGFCSIIVTLGATALRGFYFLYLVIMAIIKDHKRYSQWLKPLKIFSNVFSK